MTLDQKVCGLNAQAEREADRKLIKELVAALKDLTANGSFPESSYFYALLVIAKAEVSR